MAMCLIGSRSGADGSMRGANDLHKSCDGACGPIWGCERMTLTGHVVAQASPRQACRRTLTLTLTLTLDPVRHDDTL